MDVWSAGLSEVVPWGSVLSDDGGRKHDSRSDYVLSAASDIDKVRK